MKLLEERTQASKNEMELVEALEELRELNKRTVSVDYNTMLEKYENERQAAVDAEEAADEEFVKAVFSKEGGVKMKRIVEEDSSSEDGRGATAAILSEMERLPDDHGRELQEAQERHLLQRCQQFCLRWNDYQTTMVENFKKLRNDTS